MKNRAEHFISKQCHGPDHGACGNEGGDDEGGGKTKLTVNDVVITVTLAMMQVVQDVHNDPRDRIDAARVLVDLHDIGRA
jgi:hypothetical protein